MFFLSNSGIQRDLVLIDYAIVAKFERTCLADALMCVTCTTSEWIQYAEVLNNG